MAFNGKIVVIALHFVFLSLNPFDLDVNLDEKCFSTLYHDWETDYKKVVLANSPWLSLLWVLGGLAREKYL